MFRPLVGQAGENDEPLAVGAARVAGDERRPTAVCPPPGPHRVRREHPGVERRGDPRFDNLVGVAVTPGGQDHHVPRPHPLQVLERGCAGRAVPEVHPVPRSTGLPGPRVMTDPLPEIRLGDTLAYRVIQSELRNDQLDVVTGTGRTALLCGMGGGGMDGRRLNGGDDADPSEGAGRRAGEKPSIVHSLLLAEAAGQDLRPEGTPRRSAAGAMTSGGVTGLAVV